MNEKYILALDQGTTSSRAIIFDHDGKIVKIAQKEFTQFYPKASWVEHDAMEIWGSQSGVAREVLESAGIRPEEIAAIGIANQRETTVVWNRQTGKPIHRAIVWQCRRTATICDELKSQGLSETIQEKTGLVIDAYFSATKIMWLLDNVEGAREQAERGELAFGTIDSWLIWNLTRGQVHITDYTNASRTMMYNINTLEWDEELLSIYNIPKSMLPEVKSCSEIYGYTNQNTFGGAQIPIAGIAGDQQAALFGQTCFESGMVKNTYGTGCFILMQTGDKRIQSKNGLLTTIAWGIDGKINYALEGSVFMGGAVVQWLRDEMKLISSAEDTEYFASKVEDNGGVYLVPAFTGLGAPHWNMYARGTIVGLTRGSNRNHIIRAALESIAYQSADVIHAMEEDAGFNISKLRVDGGATANNFLLQFQSDIMRVDVQRPEITETTALGVAYLAGLAVNYWQSFDEIDDKWLVETEFTPQMDLKQSSVFYNRWQSAIERARDWK